MKKFILITIIRNDDDEHGEITTGLRPIDCTNEEEIEIHNAITSTRDPNVLLETFIHYSDPKDAAAIKKDFSVIREKIIQSNTIKVSFIPIGQCSDNCDLCLLQAIEHDDFEVMHSVNDIMSLISMPIVFDVCQN